MARVEVECVAGVQMQLGEGAVWVHANPSLFAVAIVAVVGTAAHDATGIDVDGNAARCVAGRPDGATVDSDGCYWMAGVGGRQLYRSTPDGRLDRTIDLPVERPSKPAFGGPRLHVLYVTTIAIDLTLGTQDRQPLAGRLLRISGLGVTGVPETLFSG